MEKARVDSSWMKKKFKKSMETGCRDKLHTKLRGKEMNVNKVGGECQGGEGGQHLQMLPKGVDDET